MHPQTDQFLAAQRILTLRCAAPQKLHVISGYLWITQSHDGYDHFLRAGETLLLHNERCVIEALSDSQFRWESAGVVASAKARQRKADIGAPVRWQLRLSDHLAGLLQRPFSG
jgi:hypothetical protein